MHYTDIEFNKLNHYRRSKFSKEYIIFVCREFICFFDGNKVTYWRNMTMPIFRGKYKIEMSLRFKHNEKNVCRTAFY